MNLGGWERFGILEMKEWYTLPPSTLTEISQYIPHDPFAPITNFDPIFRGLVRFTDQSVNEDDAPGHGCAHAQHVTDRGMQAYDVYLRITGKRHPRVVGQTLQLGLYSHDAYHPGCTFRRQAHERGTLTLPSKYSLNLSVEWVTSSEVNDWLKGNGVDLPVRVFVMYIHWASTFGGQAELGKELGIPTPQPSGLFGCIMRAADVCPLPDIKDLLARTIAINYGEIPAFKPPTTWEAFLQGEIDFLDKYVTTCFDNLDTVAGEQLTHHLGWRRLVQSHRGSLADMQRGKRPDLMYYAHDLLQQYNVTLG